MLVSSAELEITVQLLVQVDKLVQLIESPVFTCESDTQIDQLVVSYGRSVRPPIAASRA